MSDVKIDLTDGGITKNLLKFSFPLLLTTLLQALMGITDMFFVTRSAGEGSATAVGIGGQVVFLIVNAVAGLSAGATIVIGRQFGAGENDRIERTVGTLFVLFTILSLTVGSVTAIAARPLMAALKTPAGAMTDASAYVRISMIGLPFVFMYNGLSAVIRGFGNSKAPLVFIAVSALLNAGLDWVTVSLFKMGAGGVAAATVASQVVGAGATLIYFLKKRKAFGLNKISFKMDRSMLKELLKIGVPTAVQNSTATVSFLALTYIVNLLKFDNILNYTSAHAIAIRYNSLAILPARAMSSAIAAVTAQNLGANKKGRISRTLWSGFALSVGFGLALSLLTFFLPGEIYDLFGAEEGARAVGKAYLKAICWDYTLLPAAVCFYGVLDGYGKTGISMAINVVASLLIRAPLAYVLGIVCGWGLVGIGLSIPIASILQLIAAVVFTAVKVKKPDKTALDNKSA